MVLPFVLIELKALLPSWTARRAAAGMDQWDGPDAEAQASRQGAPAEVQVVEVKGQCRIKAQSGLLEQSGACREEDTIEQAGLRWSVTKADGFMELRCAMADGTHQKGLIKQLGLGIDPPGGVICGDATVAGHTDQIELLEAFAEQGRQGLITQPHVVVTEDQQGVGMGLIDRRVVGEGEGLVVTRVDASP